MRMVIIMRPDANADSINEVISAVEEMGLTAKVMEGESQKIVGVIGDKAKMCCLNVESFKGVEKTVNISKSYKLVSREFHPQSTVIDVDGIKIGDGSLVVMAGPCAVESKEQLLEAGVAPDLIRFSVGIENVEDIIEDLEQALSLIK